MSERSSEDMADESICAATVMLNTVAPLHSGIATVAGAILIASQIIAKNPGIRSDVVGVLEMLGRLRGLDFKDILLEADKVADDIMVNSEVCTMGKVTISEAVCSTHSPYSIYSILAKYIAMDWGDVSEEEVETNNKNTKDGKGTIFGIYSVDISKPAEFGNTVYVLTAEDHQTTKVITPEEY